MSKRRGHDRAKTSEIVGELRRRITAGEWVPGLRIPIKLELCQQFKASAGAIQRVLDTLTAEGFLRSRGCLGTFVSDTPPHRARIGMVFTTHRGQSIWHTTLVAAAERLAAEGRWWLQCYYDCHRQGNGLSPELQQLETDVTLGRVAGLVFVTDPAAVAETEAIRRAGLARVWIGGTPVPNIPSVGTRSIYTRAMDYFLERRRTRLAIITTLHLRQGGAEPILRAARQRGLVVERPWVHYFDPKNSRPARTMAELLMSLPRQRRPDAILISDDHLVTQFASGLADAGVQIPEDLDVVALANFPNIQESPLPLTFLGCDLDQVLRKALCLIDDQLSGRRPALETWVSPVFGSEWQKSCRLPSASKHICLPKIPSSRL